MGGIQIACVFTVAAAAASLWAQSVAEVYKKAEQELRTGDLAGAERDFRSVLSKDSASAGAHANLGVVYMRRKLWPQALEELGTAEKLAPGVTGIRLNIGIANFRRGDYGAAIHPLESVLRDQPDSGQAAYLVGVCYFLINRDAAAKVALEPLWEQQSSNLQYLYVLGIAAGNAGDRDLESRSLSRLEEIGDGSPQMHLLAGKAHLARQDEAAALAEFTAAIKADPKLPFGHYYLGLVKRKAHDLHSARAEFLEDSTIEPDVPFNFEELGNLAAEAGKSSKLRTI